MDVEIGVLWFSVAVHYRRRMSYRRIPLSLLFRTVRGDVNFGLRGKFWLWVELPRSRAVLVAAYRLDGLPFYRRWSFTVLPAVSAGFGYRFSAGWWR